MKTNHVEALAEVERTGRELDDANATYLAAEPSTVLKARDARDRADAAHRRAKQVEQTAREALEAASREDHAAKVTQARKVASHAEWFAEIEPSVTKLVALYEEIARTLDIIVAATIRQREAAQLAGMSLFTLDRARAHVLAGIAKIASHADHDPAPWMTFVRDWSTVRGLVLRFHGIEPEQLAGLSLSDHEIIDRVLAGERLEQLAEANQRRIREEGTAHAATLLDRAREAGRKVFSNLLSNKDDHQEVDYAE